MRRDGTTHATLLLATALLLVGVPVGCSSGGSSDAPSTPQPDAAAGTTAAGAPATPPTRTDQGRSVKERIEDASLAARVKAALTEDRRLRTFDFEPGVTEGRVTLAGNVATREQGRRAAELADDVDGVDDVLNRLTVDGGQVAWNQSESSSSGGGQMAASQEEPPGPSDGAARGSAYHTVQTGESLWAIASEYGTSVSRVKELNNMRSSSLQPGERLLVRQGAGGGTPSGAASPSVADAGQQDAAPASQTGSPQESSAQESSGDGDPASSPAAGEAPSEEETEEYHVVKRGESLWAIASKNSISVTRLKELNGLSSNDLMPGDRLRVE
jgi:LysM repeat protein